MKLAILASTNNEALPTAFEPVLFGFLRISSFTALNSYRKIFKLTQADTSIAT